jgi:hypothetical protein
MSRSTPASCPAMAGVGAPGGRVKDTQHSTGAVNPQLSHSVGSTLLLSEKSPVKPYHSEGLTCQRG